MLLDYESITILPLTGGRPACPLHSIYNIGRYLSISYWLT